MNNIVHSEIEFEYSSRYGGDMLMYYHFKTPIGTPTQKIKEVINEWARKHYLPNCDSKEHNPVQDYIHDYEISPDREEQRFVVCVITKD